jgi:hypothetical protein
VEEALSLGVIIVAARFHLCRIVSFAAAAQTLAPASSRAASSNPAPNPARSSPPLCTSTGLKIVPCQRLLPPSNYLRQGGFHTILGRLDRRPVPQIPKFSHVPPYRALVV